MITGRVETPQVIFQPARRVGERVILVGFVEPDINQPAQSIMTQVVRAVRDAKIVPKKPSVPGGHVGDKGNENQKERKKPATAQPPWPVFGAAGCGILPRQRHSGDFKEKGADKKLKKRIREEFYPRMTLIF